MTSSGPALSAAAVAARLRTAGCVFAEEEARLLLAAATSPSDLVGLVDRRVAGEPLEHVLGWVSFAGLRVVVEPGVFVPRRRTELLARRAAALARAAAVRRGGERETGGRQGGRPAVVDLCCGCGAVGSVVIAEVPDIMLYAVDIDPAAVRCARRNLPRAAGVLTGDLYAPLPTGLRGRVDVLAANAPYVPTDALPLLPIEARVHEPRTALDGGVGGLEVLRRVLAEAPYWLAPGGHIAVESSDEHAPALVDIATGMGLEAWSEEDEEIAATIVVGRLAGERSGDTARSVA